MSLYELAILGDATPDERARLTQTLTELVSAFGLTVGQDVVVRNAAGLCGRDIRAATGAAFFGGAHIVDSGAARELIRASVPVIPTIAASADFSTSVPDFLAGLNGLRRRADDVEMTELAAALLECVGLLRRQRRVFVSYRRVESRAAALQLHDLMTGRGFDVFLDTHDIRPGDPFQDVLWQRLCDSDVMVMLDTPTYFASKWTRQEIGRARAKEIHVLRVVWPEHTPSKLTDLAETIYLDPEELEGPDGPIVAATADQIMLAVESLRSRSIASRYMSITGKLRADVERIGAHVEGIGAHRAVAVRLLDDRKIWAYPVVGVPTAETLNDVAEKARRADQRERPILVYDHVGIREAWSAHLKWLDENISVVRAVKVSEAGWALAAWEG
ncbi:toll/interleukin-1 receptor domain-containing protein [Falsiroseomonas sp. HC035]|uniref:toll/interleukin-1 receptor domain-containing protein n=1 Tax=Falsiroseomonas sp. HC035 TaxID=3390999 RepID=UPI003D30EF71